MNTGQQAPSSWEQETAETTKRLGFWTFAWVATMAVATFGPKFLWAGNNTMTIVAILVNLAIGFGMIFAHKRHVLSLDELQQKVQVQTMAFTLGVAVVVGLAYSNLDVSNIISFDAEISHLVILIGLTYMTGLFIAMRRYR